MKRLYFLICLIIVASMLTACAASNNVSNTTDENSGTTENNTESAEAESGEETGEETSGEEQTAEDVEMVPAVGGTFVFATETEPDTLDVHRTVSGVSEAIFGLIGGTMLNLDPETNEFLPYLAESVTLSEDGLVWEIKIREGIKWHDGMPLTAEDYVYTMDRLLASPSPAAGAIISGLNHAEVVDDLTVNIYLDFPNSATYYGFTVPYLSPLPKHYIEEVGDEEFARNPIGCGPFIFKEWLTGEKIVLERNPDFNWGPSYAHEGPAYLESIEFRFIPEYSTQYAAFESGEIDMILAKINDVATLEENSDYNVVPVEFTGAGPYLLFNVSKAPFDDILVRKAFNLAVNREELVDAVLLGYGAPLYGVATPATLGYWDGVEEIGYGYDLEQAKAYMAEAGYELNADGVLEKDGVALELDFPVSLSTRGDNIKTGQILMEQFKDLGVILNLQQVEYGVEQTMFAEGNYTISISSWGWAEAQVLAPLFHSDFIGGMNESKVSNPDLDPLLMGAYTAINRETLQENLDAVQKILVEEAYVAPLYVIYQHFVFNNRVKDIKIGPVSQEVVFFDAYVEMTEASQ